MKKIVSLLLAFVMTLSLCVTAYAGSTTGTVALRLTGSAAEQVANLKSGQRVAADRDVVVRLNVQSDPAAAEYAVALNGQEVAADHSTSQYHFYYLPAAQLAAGTATLRVDEAVTLEGAGTEESPYLIYTAAQLGAFRDKVNTAGETGAWGKLMDDITLTGSWTPIGTTGSAYTGTFAGSGCTVSGLNVNVTSGDESSAGLFGVTGANAAIRGLTVSGSTVRIGKAGCAGAVIGLAKGAVTLENCHTTETVTVSAGTSTAGSAGGLVGSSEGGLLTIASCSSKAAVTGGAASANKGIGGLVGQAASAFSIRCSFHAGSVTCTAAGNAGGLVGYASGTVSGTASDLTDVYSAGTVSGTADSSVGGFIGKKDAGFRLSGVTNAYLRAAVTAGDGDGYAIAGSATEEIALTNVYKLTGSPEDDIGGYTNDSEAAVKTAEELGALAPVLGESWKADADALNDGFPVLAWQEKDGGEKPGVLQGSGTENDPYRIPSAKALATFRDKVNADGGVTAFYAVLTDDITLTDEAWTPIEVFTGQLDGGDHTIRGIRIDAAGSDQGLIRFTRGSAVIRDLTIADSSISVTQTRAGAFVGKADDDNGSLTLINCHAAADVTVAAGGAIAGGLVGQTAGSTTLTDCSSRAAVTSTGTSSGLGGLIGHAYNGSGKTLAITKSFHAGTVSGGKYAGGLVGQVSNDACTLTMTDVYNTGAVSSTDTGAAGSLIGYLPKNWGNKGTTTITNAYSAADAALLGKLEADKPTTLQNVYVLSGQATVGVQDEGASLTGSADVRTAAEMKDSSFGKTALGVSFTRDFLALNDGFPVLKWQNGSAQEPVTLVGKGTKADPYQIKDASDLAAFRDKVNNTQAGACAILMNDIDLQDEAFTSSWTPIGVLGHAYNGVFDGNGHTIRGIRIHNTTDSGFYAGLFGWAATSVSSPVIRNLTVADSTIINEAGHAAAILCFGGGVMENCRTAADVTVKGRDVVGGLVGTFKGYYAADHATMANCSNRAAVTQIGDEFRSPQVGGLIAYPYSVVMTGCFNAGPVSAESSKDNLCIGGLIGDTDQSDSTLTDVYNVGDVTAANSATSSIGGLVGQASRGLDIRNAYQCSTVANQSGKGGVVGCYRGGATQTLLLLNVYKTGQLPDYLQKGESSKIANAGIAVTTEQLKGFTDELGMNFVADLTGEKQLNNGLPILDWQDPAATSSDILYVSVKDVERKVRLGSTGALDPEKPTVCEIAIDCSQLSTSVADTIQFAVNTDTNNGTVRMGTGLEKDGTVTGVITANSDGVLTADGLYFAKHPAGQTRTVYVAYTHDGTTRYYQINISRSARSGVAYGAALSQPATSEDAPYTASVYEEATGYLTGTVDAGYRQFTDGAVSSQTTYGISTTGTLAENGFSVDVAGADGQKVTFARPGRYWKATSTAASAYDKVPLAAWWGSEEVAQKYLDKAAALKAETFYDKLPAGLQADFEAAIDAIEAGKDTIGQQLATRDALGAVMTGEYALETAENRLLDLMDIIATWRKAPTLGTDKYVALTRLTEKLTILSVQDITSDADVAAYETNRGYIWAMLQADSRDAVNAVLTRAKCEIIEDVVPDIPIENVELWIGENSRTLEITGVTGSTDPAAPTVLAYDCTIPEDGRMERVSFVLPDSVKAGTGLNASSGALTGELVLADGRYTAESLFFSNVPDAKTFTVYLVYTEDGTPYYYKVTVSRPAKTGLNISASGYPLDTSPLTFTSALNSGKSFAYMYVYDGAKALSGSVMGRLGVAPAWSTDTNALIYAEDTGNTYNDKIYAKRYGWYWMPVSYTPDEGETISGYLPMQARLDNNSAAAAIAAAEGLADGIPDEAKTVLTEAAAAVQAQIDAKTLNSWMYLDNTNKVKQRGYFGGDVRGTDLVENEINTLLDLTDIFTRWETDAQLADYQWQAYERILHMDGGIFRALDIAGTADRDSYQTLRDAKWRLLQAADLDGVNAILTELGLETIVVEPVVTEVRIGTAAELKSFRDSVNSGEVALNAVLTADIDLQQETWLPIGSSDAMYTGTFDGGGHTISGLNVTGVNNGLFKMTGSGAVIQNLTISASTIGTAGSTSNLLGAFVGRIKGETTLINCHTTDDVAVYGGAVGGLVGGTDTVDASLYLTLERCSNAASVTGKAASNQMGIGGLVGVLRNGASITDSCNTGVVANTDTGANAAAGGLVGSAYSAKSPAKALTMTNVYNTGAVTTAGSSSFAGGLVGNATWGFALTNAYGTMSVKAGSAYGGIIAGTVKNTVTVSNVYAELIRGGQNANCKVAISDSGSKLSKVEKMWSDTEMPVAEKVLNKLGSGFKADTTGTICGHVNYPVLAWQEAAPEQPSYTPGDVDGDGVIDTKDIAQTIRFYRGIKTPDELEQKAADVNGDGVIDTKDIAQLIRYYRGLITELS